MFLFKIEQRFQTVIFTPKLTNNLMLVHERTIDLFDSGEMYVADVGSFTDLMKTAVVLFCINSGSSVNTVASHFIHIAKSFNFTIPNYSIGQTFEIYAYTEDINHGIMLISIK